METSICSHLSAVYFFTDTIRNQCPYIGYSCSNFDDFNSGKCLLQCDGDKHQCNRMGYWASSTDGKGDLYLKTQDANALPFCSKFQFSFFILKKKIFF
jgi:pancreatic triacylglycerol lipase